MANITSSSSSEVGKSLVVAPIGSQLGYLYDYHSNVEHLQSQLKELEDVKGEVDQSVDDARKDGDEIDPDVESWLGSVNGITQDARKFLDGEKTAEKRAYEQFEVFAEILPMHKAPENHGNHDHGDLVEALELKPAAIEVAKDCASSPIIVVTVANALKDKSMQVWKDALQQLRSFATPTNNINGMDPKVYSSLKLSCSTLESEEAKSLFFLCSLLPIDYRISIQDLLKYAKGLGLFQDINTLEETRNRVCRLVHNLKASCLLLDSDIIGSVKIHDAFHDVGKFVTSKGKHISIVRNGFDLEECMKDEKLKSCPAISPLYKDIQELPIDLEYPELNFLFFCNNPSLKILDSFFKGMKQLRVLNLTNICFSSLLSSLIFLSNLQTLCLNQCMFQDIPISDLAKIGELKKLEILSFESSNIEGLPREIGQLTLLRLLDLRNCSKLKAIPYNVLASLLQLEDLNMGNSFVKWEVNGNASLAELKRLSLLVTLDIGITDAKILPKDLGFEKLKRYKIFVGDAWDWSGEY
ncbi:hypothetical protein L1049_019348 [Liquidambar formosana]|uniref:Uncharacterized protein n=1 Tax=Liquidambar formosana TaxID=63359 RepID=A0AAP0X582_LIQFO